MVFYACLGLTSVNIAKGVTSIGDYAFSKCSALTSVNIPKGVTSIGEKAFSECSELPSIIIPSTVSSLGSWVFSNCSKLTSITSYITHVFNTGAYIFQDSPNVTLYVPKGLVSTYQSTTDWNSVNQIKEMTNTYDVNRDSSIDISDVVVLVNAILASSSDLNNDVNRDEEVDISDVVKLVNIILGQ